MIRPPSAQKPYDDFWSGDPAFTQLPPDATPEQIQERKAAVLRARETGDWSALRIEGREPTKFVMKPLRGEFYRQLIDYVAIGRVGAGMSAHYAFRAGIVEIPEMPQWDGAPKKIRRTAIEGLGEMAMSDVADYLDGIDLTIITELGGELIRRAREVSPKS